MSTEDSDQNQPASPVADDALWAELFAAASHGNAALLATLCAAHLDDIAARVDAWVRAPEWARRNALTLSRWANAMMAIAEQMNALGRPEMLDRIAGRGRDNPAVRARDTLAQAQQLAAAGERETSTSMLRAVIADMDGAAGPLVSDLRSKAFGTLAENALQDHDYAALREYTRRALDAAQEARDDDGVRTFTENLDIVSAIEAYVREGGLTGDLLRCRQRIARAQQLSDETRYEASNEILREVDAELEARPDSDGCRYRAKVWGLMGLNWFRLKDIAKALSSTERALAECRRNGDRDGQRIYDVNLEVIRAGLPEPRE